MEAATARAGLINELKREIRDVRVLEAMSRIPRERFVLPQHAAVAYEDRPFPIGFGQTISQPLIVAMMTQALELKGTEKVLELGTGSGYQAAVLAETAKTVISVERLPELAEKARKTLTNLGYTNITIHITAETLGWPDEAPYDAIITTAGAPSVPPELVSQLEYEGKLVIPVGTRETQELYLITRQKHGNKILKLGGCRFVPLIGKDAWDK